jgi:hypothetical protein
MRNPDVTLRDLPVLPMPTAPGIARTQRVLTVLP